MKEPEVLFTYEEALPWIREYYDEYAKDKETGSEMPEDSEVATEKSRHERENLRSCYYCCYGYHPNNSYGSLWNY